MSRNMIKTERVPRDFGVIAWNDVPFEELLIESRDGEWGLGEPTVGHQLCEVIRGTDFAGLHSAGIELPKRWIPDHIVDRKKLQAGDIILETAGGTAKQSTGRSALLTKKFFEKHNEFPVLCASFSRHLRLDIRKFDPGFVYYLLQALYSAGYMAVYNLQHTGVARFQYTSFKKKTVLNIPDEPTQRKISATLSAYDDLIASNRRRIELLEKMAEELYREWFVRFRFPGHQQAAFNKGIPVDWKIEKLSELVRVNPPEKVDKSETKPFVAMDDLSTDSMLFSFKEMRTGSTGSKFRNRDVLLPRITPSLENGKRGFVMVLDKDQVGIGSTEFIVLREQALTAEYIYFLSISKVLREHAELSMTGASGRQRVQESCLDFFLVPEPPASIMKKFSEIVAPHFNELHLLSQKERSLAATRDALLARLISGKLPVDQLDIQLTPSMREADEALQEVAHA